MTRRDGRFWGWISGNPSNNHLWRVDEDTEPPQLVARCIRSRMEVGGVHVPLHFRADGTPPMQDRCYDCERVDREERERRKAQS
jgi:hypothetical protein